MGPMIPKEMKYNLHYGDVLEAVLPPPQGTKTSYSVVNKVQQNRQFEGISVYIHFKTIMYPTNIRDNGVYWRLKDY